MGDCSQLAELENTMSTEGQITLNEYFGTIFCINMARRHDRWAHAEAECLKHQLTIERFDAIDLGHLGNHGCTQSHRAVMGLIVERKLPRALILEDDFEFLYSDSQARFASMIGEVPVDWQMLYIGGHYAEKPRGRISQHVIHIGHMKTTSSYGVTLEMADRLYKHIPANSGDAIDELYRCFHQEENAKCYIFQPRLCVQYANFSDLQQMDCGHAGAMMDTRHENMV